MRKLNLYPLVPASHTPGHLARKQMPFVFSRVLFAFAFFTLAPASSFAQWVAQISGTANHVLGIHFVDPNTGYAAGTAGTLLKTTNGGVTWNAQTSGSGSNFYAVCFTDASTGVAVGDNSLIARTTDGGANWSLISAPVFADWRNVWFLDNNTGFITGGLSGTTANLLKTTDGGATWADISPTTFPASSEVLYSIFFTDANTGYATNYDGYILKTVDGGLNWSAQFVSNNHLFGLYFTDTNHGYCVGGDQDLNTTVILKTTDAGSTWTALDNPYPAANYLIDVEFVDANTGYAVGGHVQNNTGAILKTTDAGQTWAIENTTPPATSRLYRLSLPNATTGYACGLDGTILKFPDVPPCNNTFIQSLTNMGGSRPNIFPHPNGDFFATGLRNDSTVIVRFDPGGAPLWARAFRLGNDAVQISDLFVDAASGDLFGVAYPQVFVQSELRGVAFRYNMASHTFVWVQYIPSAANTQIHALDAQSCVLTGITSGGYTHLMRLDKNTGAINGYDLAGDSGDYYSTLFNGTLYGACRRYYDGFQASVFAHDPNNGAFLWQNTIISNNGPNSTRMYPVKPVVDNDGITVLASGDLDGFNVYLDGPVELVVAKTSLAGDVLWTKQYVVGGFDRPMATAIVPTATGYYLVANVYQPALGDFAYSILIKTDKQGQVQWAKRLGISGRNIARNIMERNGFLYLTMASDSYTFNDLLLIKLDQNGETELACDFTKSISVEVINLPNVQNVQNYDAFDHGMALAPLDVIPTETGSQTVTYCSTPCLCPDLPISAGADTTICAGRSILLEATPGFDTYQWNPATGLNDPASPNPVASPATTTTYTLVATKTLPDLPVCIYTDSVTVTVNPTDSTIFTFTRCANEPIEINGELVATDQVFTQYFANMFGCDSVVITNVKFVPLPVRAENISLCQGESVVIGGNSYTQSGTVVDTIPGTIGCDTVVTYTLTVLPLLTRAESIAFCAGESVVIGGNTYTQSATVLDTIPGTVGCDTVVTYTLTVLPLPTRAESIAFCAGESVVIGGNTYAQGGTVLDTIPGTTGCDTVVTYTLTVLPLPTRAESIAFCSGESVVIGGNTYTQPGTVQDTIPGTLGCDTVVTYTLTVLPLPTRAESIAFCPGESVVIGGSTYTQPGTVLDTIPGTVGCDTVVTYTLHYLTPAPSTVTIDCPPAVNIAVLPGAGPTVATYQQPVTDSDCPCPGISLSLTSGLPSGAAFPVGKTTVCYSAQDSCGNTASCCFEVIIREAQACDIKEIGCLKYELLTITADAAKNRTYRIRVTNKCKEKLIYTAVQLPNGITAVEPANLSVYDGETGRKYEVRNPNYSPFYSIRFKSTTDSIANGQSEIFEYTLPAQSAPDYIHITARLAPQTFYEAHLNTFNCPVGVTPTGNKPAQRTQVLPAGRPTPRLFPNPNAGVFSVGLPQPAVAGMGFRIVDLTGRLVLETRAEPGSTLQTVEAGNLLPGLYFLQIVSEARILAVEKFVKE